MLAFGDHHDRKAETPTIRLELNLKSANAKGESVVLDFMHDAEKKYGFDVIHPEVKSAAIDLVGDDDNDDDNDNDDDIDLSAGTVPGPGPGQGSASTLSSTAPSIAPTPAAPAPPKPKKRGRVEGKYDLDDPFIDDTEMLWEEQAASTKDGFFVYSGPLLQSTEPPALKPDIAKKPAPSNAQSTPSEGAASSQAAKPKTRKKPGPAPGTTRKKPRPKASTTGAGTSNGTSGTNGNGNGNGNGSSSAAAKIEKATKSVDKSASRKADAQPRTPPILPAPENGATTAKKLAASETPEAPSNRVASDSTSASSAAASLTTTASVPSTEKTKPKPKQTHSTSSNSTSNTQSGSQTPAKGPAKSPVAADTPEDVTMDG